MAIFTVTTLADQDDGNTGDGLSLREAVAAANAAAGADEIVFDAGLVNGNIVLQHGEMRVTDTLTIDADNDGDGAIDFAVDADGASQIFHVSADLTIDTLRLFNGRAARAEGEKGGAIEHTDGVLTLRGATLDHNVSEHKGGAISSLGDGLVLDGVDLYQNEAGSDGGAVFANGTSVTVTDSTIDGNDAAGYGGGLAVSRSAVTVDGSTIESNVAANGGGVFAMEGSLSLTDSVVERNGGEKGTISGGGLFTKGATVEILDSLVYQNDAVQGGGLKFVDGDLTVLRSTFAGNGAFDDEEAGAEAGGAAIFIDSGPQSGDVEIGATTIGNNTQRLGEGAIPGAVFIAEDAHARIYRGQLESGLGVAGNVTVVNLGATNVWVEGGSAVLREVDLAGRRGVYLKNGDMLADRVTFAKDMYSAIRTDADTPGRNRLTIKDSAVASEIDLRNTDVTLTDTLFTPSGDGTSPTFGSSLNGGTLRATGNTFEAHRLTLSDVAARTIDNLFTGSNYRAALTVGLFSELNSKSDTFEDNHREHLFFRNHGGAVEMRDSSFAEFRDATFDRNSANGLGGAIFVNEGSTVSVVASDINNNQAFLGGGALGGPGTLEIDGSILRRNLSTEGPSILTANDFGNPVTLTQSRIGPERLVVGTGNDVVDGDRSDNLIYLGAGNDRANGLAGNDSLHGGDNSDVLKGGFHADTLFGDNGNDTLFGEEGADELRGGAGADLMRGGNRADLLIGGDGDDSLFGGKFGDTLYGEAGADRIHGGGGADLMTGGDGADWMWGDDQADTLAGQDGDDKLFGGKGADVLRGGDGRDTLRGEHGDDSLEGGNASDGLSGNAGRDALYGQGGADQLFGGADNDMLAGGSGDDLLAGEAGINRLTGGSGADVFALSTHGEARVSDFAEGRDHFGLTDGVHFADLAFAGERILYDGDVLARVEGVATATLDASDFILV